MRYETPELTALTPAINAIESVAKSQVATPHDSIFDSNEASSSYVDWE
jgi:hypothetical protein